MDIDLEILGFQGQIFGLWQQGENRYYFGHIPDEQQKGVVEITDKKGNKQKITYGFVKYLHGIELHIGNFDYFLSILNEKEMLLIGPHNSGYHLKFEKLPNKISYSM